MKRFVVELEEKAGWDPNKHPRDKNGRFASVGATVKLPGGGTGKVTGTAGGGKVSVRRADGKTETVAASRVEVTTATAGGGASGRGGGGGGSRPSAGGGSRPSGGSRSSGGTRKRQVVEVPAGAEPTGRRGPTAGKPAAGKPAGGQRTPLSDEEYEVHTKLVESEMTRLIKAGQTTDALYTLDPDRKVWNSDRAAQHKQIVDDLYARAADAPNDGKSVIAGGLGGAGKSTVLGKHAGVDSSQYLTINPDDIKELMVDKDMVPEVEGLSPMEASTLIHEESSHIAGLLAARAYAERKNVIWDITMSGRGSVEKRINAMREKGYTDISAVFVDIPLETSVTRALARHRRGMEDHRTGKGTGGRYVPPSIIRANASSKSSSANRDVFDTLRDQFDTWQVYDNSGTGPKHVSSGGRVANLEWRKDAAGRFVADLPGGRTTDTVRVYTDGNPRAGGTLWWSTGP